MATKKKQLTKRQREKALKAIEDRCDLAVIAAWEKKESMIERAWIIRNKARERLG